MSQDRKLLFGLYATVPDPMSADARPDVELIRRARREIPSIGGLEIPYYGRAESEKYADAAVMDAMDAGWTHIITTVPAAMLHQKENPLAGLASRDAGGRAAAVNRIKGASDLIRKLNDKFGRKCVAAVQVCSSPSSAALDDRTTPESFRHTLEELCCHNWDGATINVEHCDAKTGRSLEKAVLSLDDEICAIRGANQAGSECGVVINWGRSAIELRDATRVVEHIDAAREAGLLRGLMFSGATDDVSSRYGAWKDSHPAASAGAGGEEGVPESLLTCDRITDALSIAGTTDRIFLGCKVHITADAGYSLDRAVALNRITGAAIESTIGQPSPV